MVEWLCAIGLMVGVDLNCGEQATARIERVVDGDTVVVSTDSGAAIHVRMLGIDAPEMRGRCPDETEQARRASRHLSTLLPSGSIVTLTSEAEGWTKDRYGRLLGRISIDGQDAGDRLVAKGLARYWSPPSPRINWCRG
jgi:endonuclease YncB( thermonuclease family)